MGLTDTISSIIILKSYIFNVRLKKTNSGVEVEQNVTLYESILQFEIGVSLKPRSSLHPERSPFFRSCLGSSAFTVTLLLINIAQGRTLTVQPVRMNHCPYSTEFISSIRLIHCCLIPNLRFNSNTEARYWTSPDQVICRSDIYCLHRFISLYLF
jgi:hypothetical protein